MDDDLDASDSRLVLMGGLSSMDFSVRVRPSMRLAMGLLGFDLRKRGLSHCAPFRERSNNSDRGSAECCELEGVDAWSIGCVDVRFSGVAGRGDSGDDAGSEFDNLTGVGKARFACGLDDLVLAPKGEGVRVGVLNCSSDGGSVTVSLEKKIQCS
jgi:hypothetical protein